MKVRTKKRRIEKENKERKKVRTYPPPHTCIVLEIYLFSMEGEIEIFSVCGVDL
jgi:hypothetical protein